MPCCQGQDYDRMFDARTAGKELRRYEKRGPSGETRRLLESLRPLLPPKQTFTHLDIGGGVGVLQHELAAAGAHHTVAVDASGPYLALVEQAAAQRGYAGRHTSAVGDFTEIAEQIEPASVVTLDKVICCYPDMPRLVSASAAKAQALYAIVLPKDAAWVRIGSAVANWFVKNVLRWRFRVFVHPLAEVDRLVEEQGLTLAKVDPGLFWNVRVYRRG